MVIMPEIVLSIADKIFNTRRSVRCFKAFFGVSPMLCATTWNWLDADDNVPNRAGIVHLLWMFLWLKLYDTENVLCSICGTTEKTYRKWVWIMLAAINKIDDAVSTAM